jgi:hypothetical protein
MGDSGLLVGTFLDVGLVVCFVKIWMLGDDVKVDVKVLLKVFRVRYRDCV